MRAFLGIGLAALAAASLLACGEGNTGRSTGDSEGPAGSPSQGGPGPEILSRSRGGGAVQVYPAGPGVPTPGVQGLTMTDSARDIIPADRTTAVATFLPRGATGGPGALLSQSELDALRAALTAAGFAGQDVDIQNSGNFGPYVVVRVEIPTASRVEAAGRVFAAIESSVGKPEQTGVSFGLADCSVALGSLRREAFERAEARARSTADSLGLTLGAVTAVSETQPPAIYGPPEPDPCQPSSSAYIYGPKTFGPFDPPGSTAEVAVTIQMTVTWALNSAGASTAPAGMTVSGLGRVRAKADEAYVVILLEPNYGPSGPVAISSRDRDAILDGLKDLGYDEDDISMSVSNYGNANVVSVEVTDLSNLVRAGRDIRNAVEDVVGRVQQSGALFTHSRCDVAVAEATGEAIADAEDRVAALARSAGRTAGDLVAVTEVAAFNPYGPPAPDPCGSDVAQAVGIYGGQLPPFDAPAEFEVSASVIATFTMQ